MAVRRDQTQAAEALLAIRSMPDDLAEDPLPALMTAVARVFASTARTIAFDPAMPESDPLLAETAGCRRLTIAIVGAAATQACSRSSVLDPSPRTKPG